MKIMFICTGNICRSAMAQWLLKQKLDDKEIKNVEVYSCGVTRWRSTNLGSKKSYDG